MLTEDSFTLFIEVHCYLLCKTDIFEYDDPRLVNIR